LRTRPRRTGRTRAISCGSDDCWVIRHRWGLVFLGARTLLDAEVFYIASTEDDVFVDGVRRTDLLLWTLLAAFCTVGTDILK